MALRLTSLENLFIDQMQNLYSAEHQQVALLPRLIQATSSKALKHLLEEHLPETKQQVLRLEEIFAGRLDHIRGPKCTGMEGILHEALELASNPYIDSHVLNAGLIGILLKVELYEQASYTTAASFAQRLENEAEASYLKASLAEERRVHRRLTQMAEEHIDMALENGEML